MCERDLSTPFFLFLLLFLLAPFSYYYKGKWEEKAKCPLNLWLMSFFSFQLHRPWLYIYGGIYRMEYNAIQLGISHTHSIQYALAPKLKRLQRKRCLNVANCFVWHHCPPNSAKDGYQLVSPAHFSRVMRPMLRQSSKCLPSVNVLSLAFPS